jgi:hypothetical protein
MNYHLRLLHRFHRMVHDRTFNLLNVAGHQVLQGRAYGVYSRVARPLGNVSMIYAQLFDEWKIK